MGHEKHIILLVGFFDWNDHFDQMLSRTFSQKGKKLKMVHKDAHGLVKLAMFSQINHVNLVS
jgi:hypothetical protein